MNIDSSLYIIYSSVTIVTAFILAYLFWKRRNSTGALSMSLLMLSAVEWTTCNFISAYSANLYWKTFWDNLSFLGVVSIPVLWLIFSIQYTRQDNFLQKRYYYLLSIIPLITLTIVFTPDLHHLIALNTVIQPLDGSSLSVFTYDFGFWFLIHIAYSYILISIGMFLLLHRLINFHEVYRSQGIVMISAGLIPLIGSFLYIFNLGPIKNLDITPFSFTIAGLLFFFGMFRYRLFDLVPIALTAVFETMDDCVIVLNAHNSIIDINNSAKVLFSNAMEQNTFIGQPISSILQEKSIFLEGSDDLKITSRINLNIDNTTRYYNVKVSPLFDQKNTIIGRLVVLSDITDLEEAMEKLEKSKIIAESANKAKSEFLAAMSHEIRTPLNGIIGMAELLMSNNLTALERENLCSLQYSADSLLGIINEILDFSKIESGKMEIESTCFDIRSLIRNTAATFNYSEKLESVDFSCHVGDTIPVNISGDPLRLKQILTNLISNAFKFTHQGKIEIRVDNIKESDDEVIIGFSISDTGIGIPEDKLNRLFQNFHQLDSSTTRKYGGTGLGLSIVKRLIELMSGSIKVESQFGKGSTFSFEIPFRIVQNDTVPDMISSADISSSKRQLRILAAEDSKVNRMIITQLLDRKGWMVDTVEDGKKVLEKLKTDVYDLILMDIQMPEMDGYEASKIIRDMEKDTGKHIPIIALTANATEDDKNKCIELGIDDFITKPVKSNRLYSSILNQVNSLS